MTSARLIVTIFSECFKQFNSILTKTRIQAGSSSEHLERLPVWSRSLNQLKSKIFEILLSQLWNIENFRGGLVCCLKITRQVIRREPPNAKVAFQLKCGPRVQEEMRTSDAGLRNPASPLQTRLWVTPRPIPSTDLSNSTLYFKRGSEKPHVFTSNASWSKHVLFQP